MKLEIGIHRWPLREPFTISRETITTADGVVVVDLDGPLLQAEDWPTPIIYAQGQISPPSQALWG